MYDPILMVKKEFIDGMGISDFYKTVRLDLMNINGLMTKDSV